MNPAASATPTPNPSPTPVSLSTVLGDRDVRRFIAAQLFTSTGVFLQVAVLAKQLYDITDSTLALGILGLVEFAPAAFLVLITGSIADRFNRRVVAACGLTGEIVAAVCLMLYARTDPTAAWPLYVFAFLYGTSRAFMGPAMRSIPPMIAPTGALPRTIAISSSTFTVAFIVGPAASGFLYSIDPWIAYATAVGVQLVGLSVLLGVRFRRPPAPHDPNLRPSIHRALEGLRFIRQTPILLAAIALDLFAVLFGGAVALLPAIAEDRLGVGDVAYGWLRAAIGIGSAVTAIVINIRPIQRRVGPTLLVMVSVFGLSTVVLGLTRNYAVAFIALMVLAGADMVSVFIRSTIVPLATPDDKRGRVFAVEMVFIGASNELGAFESGVAAAAFGTAFAVVSGGAATLVVVVAWWFLFPSLRRVDRFDDVDIEAGPAVPDQARGPTG